MKSEVICSLQCWSLCLKCALKTGRGRRSIKCLGSYETTEDYAVIESVKFLIVPVWEIEDKHTGENARASCDRTKTMLIYPILERQGWKEGECFG